LNIHLPEGFPEKYTAAVVNAAELCLVKKTINNVPAFEVVSTTGKG
jgi:ribosomal protein S12 methylthiotransferase accessory factor